MPVYNIGDILVWSQYHNGEIEEFLRKRRVIAKVQNVREEGHFNKEGIFIRSHYAMVETLEDTEGSIEVGHVIDIMTNDSHWQLILPEEDKEFGVIGVHGNASR